MKKLRKSPFFRFSRVPMRRLGQSVGLLLASVIYSAGVWAATADAGDETWGGLYTFVSGLFTGTAANVLSLSALVLGIGAAVVTQHKMASLVGALGVPIAIQVGPTIFQSLSGAVL